MASWVSFCYQGTYKPSVHIASAFVLLGMHCNAWHPGAFSRASSKTQKNKQPCACKATLGTMLHSPEQAAMPKKKQNFACMAILGTLLHSPEHATMPPQHQNKKFFPAWSKAELGMCLSSQAWAWANEPSAWGTYENGYEVNDSFPLSTCPRPTPTPDLKVGK